jgi:hypothetical protein
VNLLEAVSVRRVGAHGRLLHRPDGPLEHVSAARRLNAGALVESLKSISQRSFSLAVVYVNVRNKAIFSRLNATGELVPCVFFSMALHLKALAFVQSTRRESSSHQETNAATPSLQNSSLDSRVSPERRRTLAESALP